MAVSTHEKITQALMKNATTYRQGKITVADFPTWQNFREFIEENFCNSDLIFRGQRNAEWGLESSIDLMFRPRDSRSRPASLSLLVSDRAERTMQKHLVRFTKYISGKRGVNSQPIKSNNQYWALGRHYGLSTPLLDWTESPFVALFFAFHKPESPPCKKRSVWALSKSAIATLSEKVRQLYEANQLDVLISGDKIYEMRRPPIIELVEARHDDNQRLMSQAGMFTRSPLLLSLDSWVNLCADDRPILWKMTIPDDDRFSILKVLNQMNINNSSLYPDIEGASMHCNALFEMDAIDIESTREAKKVFAEWGEGGFDNDAAETWVMQLVKSNSSELIEKTLRRVLEEDRRYIEHNVAREAIAAIEVIARVSSKRSAICKEYVSVWGESLDFAWVDDWIAKNKISVNERLQELSVRALDRVLDVNSELSNDYRERGGYDEWKKRILDLKERVTPSNN